MLFPGEDADEMLAPEHVAELLRHHVDDPAGVEVIRARVYTHHSRIAARFVDGRVVLAGDAAHLMPPWAGQGMNTGIRDVMNLCWKLAAIVRGQAGRALLDTYEQERRAHAKAMIDLSTNLGRILSPTRRSAAWARDWALRAASAAPPLKRWILEMGFKPVADHGTGFVLADTPGAGPPTVGRMVAQPRVETTGGARVPLDEVLGSWFAVVGFECDPLAGLSDAELAALDRFRPRVIRVLESRAGQRHHQQPCVRAETVVVEDVENQLRPWFQARGRRIALVRPDRYVAVSASPGDFGRQVAELSDRYVRNGTA
jgi:3-(3-hydroxy-phenyl)propionate hydroxylase